MSLELDAFGEANFSWVRPLESVWSDAEATTGGPNDVLEDRIIAELLRQTKDPANKPLGRLLVGQAGIGKTHLVGNLCRKVWKADGWFVLLDVIGITDFWKSAALSFLTSLLQQMPNGVRQSDAVLAGVANRLKIGEQVEEAFRRPDIDTKQLVDILIPGLAKIDLSKAQQHQNVFRALALLRSPDFATVGTAHAWLQGYESDEDRRKALGLTTPPPEPIDLVRGMSWLMSIAGPTLVAVDQVDGVINAGSVSIQTGGLSEEKSFAELLSAGLLQLYDALTRSQTVLTCLLDSWKALAGGLKPFVDRFQPEPTVLVGMNETTAVQALIEGRLAQAYSAAGHVPPFPTWPFSPAAIDGARGATPRQILMSCDRHRRDCLDGGAVAVCNSLHGLGASVTPSPDAPAGIEQEYVSRRAKAQIAGILDDKDDGLLGRLLRDVFDLYASQIEPRDNIDVVSKGDAAQRMPPLHGRLTFTFHDEKDREHHFCFRALEHSNAIAYSARLRAAVTASGIGHAIPGRELIIVRRGAVPSGAKTQQLHQSFLKAGGKVVDPTDDDLRSFVALCVMREAAVEAGTLASFEAWLRQRQPLCSTAFFSAAGLCPPPIPVAPDINGRAFPHAEPQAARSDKKVDSTPSDQTSHTDAIKDEPAAPPSIAPPTTIPVGHRMSGGEPVNLPTSVLPRHTAIIAGAGSGKTVLLRRVVEEAALAQIPAIVIDPNNDLSRLGDSWPQRPAAFSEADAEQAARYFNTVEVVVWTPGVLAGNPLFLPVLPDFAAIGDDPDEQSQAVTMAAETLGPLAGAKTNLPKGVLSDTLRHFAQGGGGTLANMTSLLADLPDGVSDIGNAAKLAGKMADELKASVATNPLLKATGPVLDPKLLFFGKDKARTRVSVINLSGLASDDAKEDFVNRLQMTLFGWIKKNPSPKGMLYVIDEAQTFIPSGAGALSKTSGVQLVAQARKYGLGMIVVTQAPKGVDNKVVSNCTTHFLGKQNAPATIDAAKELIAAAGGKADDMGKLATGEFYFKTEKSGKPFKVKTPICLSWHPPNPPTPEEVVAKARNSALAV
jgi:Helicase HerA, central domain